MPFMEKQITEKMRGWEIETNCGTSFVPQDVHDVPSWLVTGAHFSCNNGGGLEHQMFEQLRADLNDYVEGREWYSIEVCEGYFARMSANGYLDCTEWSCFATVKEAEDYLDEHYGEDHEAIYQGQMS